MAGLIQKVRKQIATPSHTDGSPLAHFIRYRHDFLCSEDMLVIGPTAAAKYEGNCLETVTGKKVLLKQPVMLT